MKLEPEYKHLVQKPQLCFPTNISMVCLRRGHWLDQEEIAIELGLKITKDVADSFNYDYETTDNILEAGYDVRAMDVKKLNALFEKNDIPISVEFVKPSQIENVDEFIISNLKQGNDMSMLFLWKGLGRDVNWAHYVLITAYDSETKLVDVCDPLGERQSYWTTDLSKFLSGMSTEWDGKERGFLVFKSSEK